MREGACGKRTAATPKPRPQAYLSGPVAVTSSRLRRIWRDGDHLVVTLSDAAAGYGRQWEDYQLVGVRRGLRAFPGTWEAAR